MAFPKLSNVSISLYDGLTEKVQLYFLLSFGMSRSILTPSAKMSFSVSKAGLGLDPYDEFTEDVERLLVEGNMVRGYVDGVVVFTGYITSINPSSDANVDVYNVDCKDIIWRLQSTTLNHTRTGINGKLPLNSIVLWALKGLETVDARGLPNGYVENDWFDTAVIKYNQADSIVKVTGKPPVKDVQTEFETLKEQDVKPKQNENIYGFLTRLIRPWGFILQADAEGNLVFFRPNQGDTARHMFVNDTSALKSYDDKSMPMLNASLSSTIEDLHSHYYVFAPSTGNNKVTTIANYKLENPDYPKLAPHNILMHYDENLKSKAQCEKMARRKAGFEIANAWKYSFRVNAFKLDKVLFWNDTVINVADDINMINELDVYVVGVEFEATGEGQSVSFECTKTTALMLEES